MRDQMTSRRLRLVKPPERRPVKEADFTAIAGEAAQATLFPAPRPGIVLFVYMSDATETEFRDALSLARPRLVVELRRTPWLDIGRMDRRQVFECFDRVHAQYIDLAWQECSPSPESVRDRIDTLLRDRPADGEGPLMFLFGSRSTVEDLPGHIVAVLSAARRKTPEVHEVPSFVSQ